jgi:hypothetical protein
MRSVSSGYSNTAIGKDSAQAITSGVFNVCIGTSAEVSTGAAENQIAIGYGTTAVGNNSVTLGNSSVTDVYMSSDKDAMVHCGSVSGSNGSTGSFSALGIGKTFSDLYLGTKSIHTKGYIDITGNGGLSFNDNASTGYYYADNIATISSAYGTAFKTYNGSAYVERMRIAGNQTNATIGIGTASPNSLWPLHVWRGNAGTDPSWETTVARNLGLFETDNNEAAITIFAPATANNLYYAFADPSHRVAGYVKYAHNTDRMTLGADATDIVFISGSSPEGLLTIEGNKISGSAVSTGSFGSIEAAHTIRAEDDVVAFYTSDERLKDNVKLIEKPIEKVQQLRGVEYQWNGLQNTYASGSYDSGIIAQDVQKVLPQIVKEKNTGYLGVRHDRLVGLLIEGIKEQQEQIDDLRQQIKEIKNGSP